MRKCECGHKYGEHFRRRDGKPCRICDCEQYRSRGIVRMELKEAKEIIEVEGIKVGE